MDGPNALAVQAMGQRVVRPYYIASLDILGDPIYVTNAPYGLSFSENATGDDGLDGKSFSAVDHRFINISPVRRKEGGTETVTCTMSGMIGIDNELMNAIGDSANWQGREIRLWQMRYDENLQLIGNIWPFHTGYMTVPKIVGDRTSQTISLDSESYLAYLTNASNRTYLDAELFDANDKSAAASIACANGQTGAGASVATASGGGGGNIDGRQDYQAY